MQLLRVQRVADGEHDSTSERQFASYIDTDTHTSTYKTTTAVAYLPRCTDISRHEHCTDAAHMHTCTHMHTYAYMGSTNHQCTSVSTWARETAHSSSTQQHSAQLKSALQRTITQLCWCWVLAVVFSCCRVFYALQFTHAASAAT